MKRILFLLLLTVSVYGQNPSRFAKIQITGNTNSGTATKVNVQEANGEVNTQTINTGFNKNIGLGGSDVVGANTLLNQYSTTPVDWTATAFNSGQVVFYGGKQWIAKMATVAGDVPAVSSKWEEITFESLANKTITVDAIPTGGSNNAVSSNGVFDALATKAPISSVHNPVTLGTTNGLSLSNQQLSLGLASSGVTGALSGTDWNTFNNKVGGSGSTNFLTKWSGTNTVNASGAWRETSNRLANAADNGSSEFQVTGQIALKSKNTQGDGGQLGAELLTTGSSDASWTGTSFATGYTHVAGSATTLTSTLSPVVSNLYQLAYTVTGRTAGSFTIVFGGTTTSGITSTGAVGYRTSTTGALVITPTSDFNGTIVLSIKQITAGAASFVFRDNGGTIRSELRCSGINNTANGTGSLQNNTTGSNNTANGVYSLQNNTTGTSNTANGVSSLQNNTTGNNNTAIGTGSLLNNTTGGANTAIGVYSLLSNTTGTNNTANGVGSLQSNTTGNSNTANGVYSLQYNTTGTSNTANGVNAGRFIANGSTSLTVANNSTFLGFNTRALADNSTNETVVGYNAIGDGNNTVSIGNTSVVSSRLRGRILQGDVVDNLIDSGQFSGNVLATGFKTASGTASQFLKANGSVDSNTYLTSASLPTVDQTIIDGSTNAVSGNAVFDGLATKSNIGHTHVASQITDLSKASVGLGNVDNTSDLSKPLSTATINALATKFPTPTGLTTNYLPKWNGSGFGNSAIDEQTQGILRINRATGSLGDYIGELLVRQTNSSGFDIASIRVVQEANIFEGAIAFRTNTTGNAGMSEKMRITSGGKLLINTTTDNGVDQVQVNGTISASPATTANQVPTWGQVQAITRPYKVYTALLTQTGTNAPTATVLENTLGGTVVWSRNNVGVYLATLNGSFIANKTVVFVTPANSGNNYFLYGKPSNINSCTLQVFNTVGQSTDGLFTDVSIEIRVYN